MQAHRGQKRAAIAILALATLLSASAPAFASGEEAETSGKKTGHAIEHQNNITMDPLTVTVFNGTHTRGLLAVDLSLELLKPKDRDRIEKIMPRLRDRYVTLLTRFAANRVDVNRTIDIDAMNDLLQNATDAVLGQHVSRVLIGGATVRRL